jgi:hypothetical protein
MSMAEVGVRGSEGFEPPKYLSSLIAAVNDGAKAAQSGALAFALVGVYLLATAFSASDEDLLRGRAVTISQIGATLPVSFSFAIAPFVFVFLHTYTLARYDMVAANIRQFLSELRRTVIFEADQERCRQLLANVEFVQALVAPRGSRGYSWVWRWLVRVMIAGFPVFVLLLVQINALRYQNMNIMWVQRTWLLIDLIALIWFFYRNPLKAPRPLAKRIIARVRRWADLPGRKLAVIGPFVNLGWPEEPEGTAEQKRAPIRRLTVLASLPVAIAGVNLLYMNVVPTSADPEAVRYDGTQNLEHYYIAEAFLYKNPLDCKNRSKPAPDFGRKRQVISAESGT